MKLPRFFGRPVLLSTLLCSFASALRAQAQPPAPPTIIDQVGERAQREEQDRLRQQFEKDRQAAQPPATLTVPAAPVQQIHAPANLRRHISRLEFEGSTLMGRHYTAWLRSEFENRDLAVKDLEELLGQITAFYVRRGYVTARAYVPQQDLSTGVLKIRIVEGRVEKITADTWAHNLFPTSAGAILNLRDLEQGVDNINRLQSRRATLDLQPGTTAGDTVVDVKEQTSKFWHVNLSGDNTGTEDTGSEQAAVGVALDNPLSLGDELSVNYRSSVPYHSGSAASAATTGSYVIPWGYQLFTLGASYSNYALTVNTPSGFPLPFTGDSRTGFLRTDRVLYRGQTGQLGVSGTLTWKSSRNYLLGNYVDVSSRELTVLDIDLNYSTAWKGAFVSASVGGAVGLPIFGAMHDASGLPSYAPRAEYTKWSGSLSYNRPFHLEGLDFLIASSVNGQVADNVLYGTEQITVGGIYAVRGFDRTNLGGDSGYVWRNDLSMPLSLDGPFHGRFGKLGLRPYVGADWGQAFSKIHGIPDYSPPAGTLAGLTVGAAANLGTLNAELFYSKPVRRPAAMTYESGHLYFRTGISF